jgi:hypothetical protein
MTHFKVRPLMSIVVQAMPKANAMKSGYWTSREAGGAEALPRTIASAPSSRVHSPASCSPAVIRLTTKPMKRVTLR